MNDLDTEPTDEEIQAQRLRMADLHRKRITPLADQVNALRLKLVAERNKSHPKPTVEEQP